MATVSQQALAYKGQGPGGSDLTGWRDPRTGKTIQGKDPGNSAYSEPIGGGGGGGGGGGDGGGGRVAEMGGDFFGFSKEWNDRAGKIAGILEDEYKAYIRGERNIGKKWVTGVMQRVKPELGRQADLLKGQSERSANARGLIRSSVPGFAALDIDKTMLRDIGDIRQNLESQRKLVNIEQGRFGASGLSGLLSGTGNMATSYAGLGLNANVASMQNNLGLTQLAQNESQFNANLGFQNRALDVEMEQRARESRRQKAGGVGQGIGNIAGAGLFGLALHSDMRVKENIVFIGIKNGLRWYEFSYKGYPSRFRGVMAQEVMKVRPDVVYLDKNGYKVDYRALGIKYEEMAA